MRATPQRTVRNPLTSMRDTRQCPVCKSWIDCSPPFDNAKDVHIQKEHPDVWDEYYKDSRAYVDPEEQRRRLEQKMARAAAAEAKPPKEPKEPKPKNICLCGCERETGGRFAPGHDATLKSVVLNILKEDPEANLAKAKALTAEQKKALNSEDLFKGRFIPNFK